MRAAYDGKTWGIGVNPVTSTEPLWYSLADCVASKLLDRQGPESAPGRSPGAGGPERPARSVKLRGTLDHRPIAQGPHGRPWWKSASGSSAVTTSLASIERDRLSAALKIVANAGVLRHLQRVQPQGAPEGRDDPGAGPRPQGALQ